MWTPQLPENAPAWLKRLVSWLPRLSDWTLVGILLLLAVWHWLPVRLLDLLFALTVCLIASIVALYFDRGARPYMRPFELMQKYGWQAGVASSAVRAIWMGWFVHAVASRL